MSNTPTLVKCLIWDLDNTLWDGTLTEDESVRVSDQTRAVIAELDSRGILQSVASKNDHDHAWPRLEQLGLAEYFVFPQIGWGAKSESVARIAQRLNFAQNTVAFIDDMPNERAEVAYHAPQVRCYSAEQALALPTLPEFSPAAVTTDARMRRQMYQAGFQRDAEKQAFIGPDEDFLRTLDLALTITRATEEDLTRVEELTLRTSQMNATGVHYPHDVLRDLLADSRHEVLTMNLTDRFGPHGSIGIALLERRPTTWHVKLLATSCRVVSFGVGAVILNWLIDQAARGGTHLVADFRPTDRNRMMDIAYRFAGFTDHHCPCLADLASEPSRPEVQRLHLTPDRRPAPATMRVVSPELAAPAAK